MSLKVLSLFSGIGAFESALTKLEINYELVGFSEIDKYAIKSYCAIHNVDESLNLGDVSKVDASSINNFDIMTYGFPCTDISIAGRQLGLGEGSGTRSSLLWEAMKIAQVKKPKYMIAENVKNLVGKKFKDDFDKWLTQLDDLGYNTYWEVLNAKDFGVPQNRERVFAVSIRKDIDEGNFKFPIGYDVGIRLKDILEDKIDKKYYLSEDVQKRFKLSEKFHKNIIGTTAPEFRTIGQRDLVYKEDGIMGALVATDYKQPKQIIEGFTNYNGELRPRENEIATCLDTRYGSFPDNHGARTGIIEFENEIEVVGNLAIKGLDVIRRVYSPNGVSPTLTTMEGGNRQPKVIENDLNISYKIRKLSPKECWRLMGFSDEDFDKAKESLNNTYHKGKDRSDSQMYKQAGNSIVVNVVVHIFKELFNIK